MAHAVCSLVVPQQCASQAQQGEGDDQGGDVHGIAGWGFSFSLLAKLIMAASIPSGIRARCGVLQPQ